MTDLTYRLSGCRLVQWFAQWRLIRWLWRYRWPGAPLTLVALLTVVQHFVPPDEHPWLDRLLVIEIAVACVLLLAIMVLGTERPWGPKSTGIFLFVLGDLTLYGVLALPRAFGWDLPYRDLAGAFLRANVAVGPPVLILVASDWGVDWWRGQRGGRIAKE